MDPTKSADPVSIWQGETQLVGDKPSYGGNPSDMQGGGDVEGGGGQVPSGPKTGGGSSGSSGSGGKSTGGNGLSRVALVGFGGCGKTQLAIEYAYQPHTYDAILWCAAENNIRLGESYATHARALGLIGEDEMPQQDRVTGLMKQWLVSCSRSQDKPTKWLIVFDNMEEFDELASYWPSGASGSIIITTRNRTLAKRYAQVQVPVSCLETGEAGQFLLDFCYHGQEVNVQDQAATAIIAEKLHSLPLALDLVRHYVSSSGSSYSEFLESYGELDESLLLSKFGSAWQNPWYRATIATTYTFQIHRMSKNAVLMMYLLSILDPDRIPISFFNTNEADMLYNGPDMWDEVPELHNWLQNPFLEPFELDTAVSELLNGSFIIRTVGSRGLNLHRIIQGAVVRSMDTPTRSEVFRRVLFFLNSCFPKVRDGGRLFKWWVQCEEYVPHVIAVTRFFKKHREELETPIMLSEIIRRCAWYLLEKHQFTDAKSLVLDGIAICKEAKRAQSALGFTYNRYLPRLTADLYRVMGSLECESHTEGHGLTWAIKARTIRQELYLTLRLEQDKKMLQVDLSNVGVDMLANGRPQDALPVLQGVYEYDVDSGGINPVNFYRTINLSICYRLLRQYSEAVRYSDIAMKVIRDHIGEDGVPMATAQFFLGSLLLCTDDRVGAFEAFSRCFRIRQNIMSTHFDTAFAAHKLGVMSRENGDLQASITFLKQALRVLGDVDNFSLAATRTAHLLSTVLQEDGRDGDARVLKDRVNQALDAEGERANACSAGYSEDFFDQFVLFKHV
ncbi:hypothetical protein FSARC_2599 [Fusarium sarcochroum]|uniref:NB-ARC domain-containing protein n=1 Tax=Fusarium sarcochroum TaxID=1208366 RepID=A0A8H4U6C8_9HYPO|nr:hypothetical protein FSARC_2599 [Fusarium sarcochroum]